MWGHMVSLSREGGALSHHSEVLPQMVSVSFLFLAGACPRYLGLP